MAYNNFPSNELVKDGEIELGKMDKGVTDEERRCGCDRMKEECSRMQLIGDGIEIWMCSA